MTQYFDFSFKLIDGNPKTSVKLKDKYKKNSPAIRKSGIPYSGVQKEFYFHHISDKNLAIKLWEYRKSLANKSALLELMYKNKIITDAEWEECKMWIERCDAKCKKNHKAAISKKEYRENLKKSFTDERIEKMRRCARKRWEDNYDKMYSSLNSNEVKEKRAESFRRYLNDPSNYEKYLEAMRGQKRIEKISKAAKIMWQQASDEKKARMRPNWAKTEIYCGLAMNKIEKRVAKILDELKIGWEYEPIIRVDKNFVQPDFVIEGRLVLECFGDFWHANPKFYSDCEILFAGRTAKQQRSFDEGRLQIISELYPDPVVLWESEIKQRNIKNIIKERILCRL